MIKTITMVAVFMLSSGVAAAGDVGDAQSSDLFGDIARHAGEPVKHAAASTAASTDVGDAQSSNLFVDIARQAREPVKHAAALTAPSAAGCELTWSSENYDVYALVQRDIAAGSKPAGKTVDATPGGAGPAC